MENVRIFSKISAISDIFGQKYGIYIHYQQQPFNGLFSRTTWVSRYQKGKTNLDFTGARE